jgi:hypothetical protein
MPRLSGHRFLSALINDVDVFRIGSMSRAPQENLASRLCWPGQRLGVREIDEGIWLASFLRYDPGCFDLEQKILQPIDNPFGTRSSPMS